MPSLRLVILDYAKEHLQNPAVHRSLSDMLITKQKNFERTDANYIVTDKHDMIGTHLLIYETTKLFAPRLIFAIRLTYEDRCQKHKLKTPFQDLVPYLDERINKAFQNFRSNYQILVDCNSWFVDSDYSFKSSGLRLSDLGYLMIYLQLSRMGHSHFVGCTNERYKASRWIENIGHFPAGYDFIHPTVNDTHRVILMNQFKHDYLQTVFDTHQPLLEQLYDLSAPGHYTKSIPEILDQLFKEPAQIYPIRQKAG